MPFSIKDVHSRSSLETSLCQKNFTRHERALRDVRAKPPCTGVSSVISLEPSLRLLPTFQYIRPLLGMSSTNEIGGAADARAAPKKWEFVNINKPKKHLDKEVISQVRAHATRNVRRKQRLELTAQYQKKVQATEPQSDHADSGVIAKRPVEIDMNDWLIGDKVDDDWSVALHVVLSRLGFMDVGLLASRDRVSCATEGDEDIQRHTSWRSCEEDKIWGSISRTFGTSLIGNPQSLVGGGVFDPFDALPVPGWSSYKSHVLKHCRCLLPSTFLFSREPKYLF